ncbi:hypothetical protein SBV1_3590002 [Verrucomicrobia bacterium]|nr:hypothetical protein SBV1_3590002 [Verrucomicrobiota bacterium]
MKNRFDPKGLKLGLEAFLAPASASDDREQRIRLFERLGESDPIHNGH